MKIAIDHPGSRKNFCTRFEAYCRRNNIDCVLVNCTDSDIVEQLADCDALVWHWPHANHKYSLLARQLTCSLQAAGKVVFPDIASCWHFDDKIGQKYLFEALDLPLVPTFVFYDKKQALDFLDNAEYPLVFKLKSGAGSSNVKLVKNRRQGRKLVKKMFAAGLPVKNIWNLAWDDFQKFRHNKAPLRPVFSTVKSAIKAMFKPAEREHGYVYFQKFIAGNEYDIRAIVINGKVFEIKRMCRTSDFRASGSGMILYEKAELSERCAEIALAAARKMQTQCAAFDFVFDNGQPLLLEVSYGFILHVYDPCTGYWDADLNWHAGNFNPQDWIMDEVINKVKECRKQG